MRALFVGDVHNHKYIFDDVKRLDDKYKFDRIIFLGDYVDDWNTDNHQSLETLDVVFGMKSKEPEKYTLLIGNHELSYLGFSCSGHQFELEDVMKMKLTENIDKLDFYTTVQCGQNEYVCTHAGLNNGYINEVLNGDKWKETIDEWSKDKLSNLEMLSICGYIRGGNADYSSFVWCDRREHAYFAYQDKIIPYQIVGHTPAPNIQIIGNIIYCDTHSTFRDGSEYGDKSYLIWNDKGFTIEN